MISCVQEKKGEYVKYVKKYSKRRDTSLIFDIYPN